MAVVVCILRERQTLDCGRISCCVVLVLGRRVGPDVLLQSVYSGPDPDYAKLLDDYRRTIVQILGGAVLVGTLYFTYRRTKAVEETLSISQKTLEATRETQITDRFTRAVEQLGAIDADGKKLLETRLGGIYSLERIAKDSPKDHWTIIEILTGYVRVNSGWNSKVKTRSRPQSDVDIHTVLTVIGRRNRANDNGELDFGEVDLRNKNFSLHHFEKANFLLAHCEFSSFINVRLEEASMDGINLESATLLQVDLRKARLTGANMKGSTIMWSNLEGANLSTADLQDTRWGETSFIGALLYAANMRGAWLTQSQLDSALGNDATVIPDDLERPGHWEKMSTPQSSDIASSS